MRTENIRELLDFIHKPMLRRNSEFLPPLDVVDCDGVRKKVEDDDEQYCGEQYLTTLGVSDHCITVVEANTFPLHCNGNRYLAEVCRKNQGKIPIRTYYYRRNISS